MSDEQQSGVCSESSDYKLAKAAARPGAIVKLPLGTPDAIWVASAPHLELLAQIQESVRAMTEQFTKNLEGLFSHAAQISSLLSSQLGVLDEFRESVCSNLVPMMERLAEIGASLDWEAILEDSRRWGSYGWAITNDQFTYNAPPRCPSSLEEADAVYLSFLDVDALIAGLEGSVAKKVDFREAVELFRERHYKPCAMMLCSLIDRELFRACCGPRRDEGGKHKQRSWSRELKKLKGSLSDGSDAELSAMAISIIDFANICEAVDYFFRAGDDFNREREGELNRNFLQHGMMYKPVRRKTCIKLFVLLDAVSSSLPDALGYVSDLAKG